MDSDSLSQPGTEELIQELHDRQEALQAAEDELHAALGAFYRVVLEDSDPGFNGRWFTSFSKEEVIIEGLTLTWSDGIIWNMEEYEISDPPQIGDSFEISSDGERFGAKIVDKDTLKWTDGDIWRRIDLGEAIAAAVGASPAAVPATGGPAGVECIVLGVRSPSAASSTPADQ